MRKNLYTKRAGFRSHGKSHTVEFRTWWRMLLRCHEPTHHSFKEYGGRGIKVAKVWRGPNGFSNFLAHVGKRPSAEHSIDRWPDNDGDYKPGNVRWATRNEQGGNTRKAVLVEFKGETRCLRDWARVTGIHDETIRGRLKNGWTVDDALTIPPSKRNPKRGSRA